VKKPGKYIFYNYIKGNDCKNTVANRNFVTLKTQQIMSFFGTDGAHTGAAEPDDGGGVHRRVLGGLLVKLILHHGTDHHPSRRENEGLKS